MNPVWICSMMAQKIGTYRVEHCAFLVAAVSADEAAGAGLRHAKISWPVDKGWANHSVSGAELLSVGLAQIKAVAP